MSTGIGGGVGGISPIILLLLIILLFGMPFGTLGAEQD